MKNLILSTLIVGAASQAAGCIIVSDDDPTGTAVVNWQPLTADANGDPVTTTCPTGATTAIIFAQPVGSSESDSYLDKYDCSDISGVANDLPVGDYDVFVRLTDTPENITFAESGQTRIAVVEGGATPVNAAMYVDHAFYALDWTLTAQAGGALNCSQVVGENGVSIVATASGGSGFIDTIVDCEAGENGALAFTDPLPLTEAGYTLAVDLLNAADQSIGTAPAIVAGALRVGNTATDVGTAAIVVR